MKHSAIVTFSIVVLAAAFLGCTPSPSTTDSSEASSARALTTSTKSAPAEGVEKSKEVRPALAVPGSKAEIGKPAPGFTLADETGKPISLDAYKGKIVVLEWFNPDCPFVKASHEKGSMKSAMKKAADMGAVWLAINSAAPGKQGHGAERNAASKKPWSLAHPILMDEGGEVGRAYGAQRTPHMYVIDEAGVLVYAGAIDNSPDGERGSPKEGKLVSHVEDALDDVSAKRPVNVATTEPYGCSVKYAN